jgi:hypothetical protein
MAASSFGTGAMLMQALNPASKSGINISSLPRYQRIGLPIINQFHNIANIPQPIR